MAYEIENNCVGCERCAHCGRDRQEVHYCDKCGDYADGFNPLYVGENGEELCWDCYKEQFNEKMCDDMDDERCHECHNEADFLYQKDGYWYCSECLEKLAEKVDLD